MKLLNRKSRKETPLSIGDRVEEKSPASGKVRLGEIILVREGRQRSFELIQLNPHDLEPIRRGDFSHYKRFRLNEDRCKRLNKRKFSSRRTFKIGDIVRKSYHDHVRYGRIVNFVHPEGLLTTSHENGYNGKDLLECIEISGKPGLSRKRDTTGDLKRFVTGPERCQICKIVPMDKKGGVRIEKSKIDLAKKLKN